MIFCILSLSRPFPINFGLKRSYDGVLLFFEFFCNFFGILYSGSGRNPSERFFFFKILFSLFLGLSQPILAWKEAIMLFFNFLNLFFYFFGIFYSGSGRNTMEWFFIFYFFYFLSFSVLTIPFWLEKKLLRFFPIFWIFMLFFSNFILRVG